MGARTWQVAWLAGLLATIVAAGGMAVAQPSAQAPAGPEMPLAEVEIVAEQDVYIACDQPDTNFGGSDALFIG